MQDVYFESYEDCLGKIGSILQATIQVPLTYTYTPNRTEVDWQVYDGPIVIGDNSAVFLVSTLDPLRHIDADNSSKIDYHVSPSDGAAFCGADGSNFNFNSNGSVIPDSALDQFVKSIPSHLLTDAFTGGPNCPPPTPANIGQPFLDIGPYSCTKTTQIIIMTAVGVALAWLMKTWEEKVSFKQSATDNVAPNTRF